MRAHIFALGLVLIAGCSVKEESKSESLTYDLNSTAGALPEGKSSKTLRAPAPPDLGSMDVTPKQDESKAEKLPTFLRLVAKSEKLIAVSPQSRDDEKIVTLLNGTLKIQTADPDFDVAKLNLAQAKSARVVLKKLENCTLSAIKFENPNAQKMLNFSIQGEDSKSGLGPESCLTYLTEMSYQGFSVELLNVATGTGREAEVGTVLIQVEAPEAAAQRQR